MIPRTPGLVALFLLALCADPALAQGQDSAPRGLRPAAQKKLITLDDATTAAMANSIDLRVAAARVDEANARVRQAWSYLLPNVSLAGEYNYNFPEQTVAFGDPDQFQQQALLFDSIADITEASAAQNPDPIQQRAARERAAELRAAAKDLRNSEVQEIAIQPSHVVNGQLQFAMPLFSGRALPLLQNAYTGVEMSRLGMRQARAAIGFAVARVYYQVVATQRVVEIARGQAESAGRHLELARQREQAGYLTELQRQRAELELARAEQQHKAAANGLKSAKAALGALIGQEEDFDVGEPAPQGAAADAAIDALVAQAAQSRTDVKLQQAALDIADRNTTDAWMRFLPSLRLIANGRYTTNTSGFVSEPFTGVVGVQASLPIFDGGLAFGAVEESNAQLRQQLLRTRQLELQVEQEVRGAIDDVALKLDARDTSARVAALAKAQHENAERLFDAGLATSLDVSDARLAAFAAEVDAARARYDLEVARLGLRQALGALDPAPETEALPVSDDDESRARRFVDAAD